MSRLLGPVARAARSARAAVEAIDEQRRRTPWPTRESSAAEEPGLAVVIVNYNTIRATAQAVYSLYRVLDPGEFSSVIVVDNRSTDDTTGVLGALDREGLITLVDNPRRPYHGPGLNRGVSFLAARQAEPRLRADLVCVMDSDVVALRAGAFASAVARLRAEGAALVGPVRASHPVWDPYAHVSCNIFDPAVVWQPGIPVFRPDGHPGIRMQQALVRRGLRVVDFPFYAERHLVHVGRATSAAISESGDWRNWYFSVARRKHDRHYEDVPGAAELHAEFERCFDADVPDLEAARLVAACGARERLRFE